MTRGVAPPPEPSAATTAGVARFGPAVDRWLLVAVVLSGLAMLVAPIAVALDPDADALLVLLVIGMDVLMFALVALLAYPIVYELDLTELRVRAGVTRTKMVLADVVRVEIAFSPVSNTTAAWTMHRIHLTDARGRTVAVGPRDRLAFVAEVLARAPHLVEDTGRGRGRVWVDPARTRRR